MISDSPTWGTVSTVLEPPQILLAFAAHHLHAGASELHLYLDRPSPIAQDWLKDKHRIALTVCDADYWQRAHGRTRPDDSRERQILNARHAYARSRCTWLAHIDADEFIIRVPEILRFLQDRPPEIKAVSLHNAERVLRRGQSPGSVFDGLFRKPFAQKGGRLERVIYGDGADFLLRGFSGYSIGKSFFRVGAGLELDLHVPAPPEEWYTENPARAWFPRIGLLHVDGYTRAHWEDKLRKKTELMRGKKSSRHNPARTKQIQHFLEQPGQALDTDQLYNATRTLTKQQILQMLWHRKLMPARLCVNAALKAEFPGVTADLSPAAIDAALEDLKGPTQ